MADLNSKNTNKKNIFSWGIFGRISMKEKIFFTKNLAVMAKSGLSLSVALEILANQTTNKKFEIVLKNIKANVEKGNSLTSSLSKYPEIFSEITVNMIEAGEKSGKLEDALNQVTLQMKKNYELVSKIKSALTYPLFILTVMAIIGIFMFLFIIPKMLAIFEEIDAPLPLVTKILIKTSDLFSQYAIYFLFGLIILIILFIKFKKTKKGKIIIQGMLLETPIFSEIIKKINLAKFCRTFSSLLTTDIPIVQTLKITANVLNNVHYKQLIIESCEEVKKGNSVAALLEKKPKLFPPLLTQMVKVGEQTGTLDNILNDLTLFYEQEVKDTLDTLASLIEPILIVVLGVGVGLIASAIILPMYSMTQAF
ncbi:MAG: Uncharacterized protein Athens101410_43 [Parcubacteria group bacterium Athens1014_10]|nr:MAG: Uncharacterized protein Athens101410_43 [Parcubacteria group bacterium Athens1014_10]TSD06069.1 MAG: Uncharacterized protein Athens071412_43 [Parcubacteria group bacterium Athens0714_12]